MKSDTFRLYIDRLRKGQVEKISGPFSPSFLGMEEELKFPFPVEAEGEAYLSEEHLIIRLKASVRALLPCCVCNEWTEITLKAEDFYHTVPLEEIKGALYSFEEPLREALLIEIPLYAECTQGKCPKREAIAPYMRQKKARSGEDTYFPFSQL